jgi:diguanylate cyclase (GGDEF)-like protein
MVMLVDVDHFKSINDRFGHDGGDAVLQHLASTLKRSLRADDLVYRYGGEEFLLLMELPAAVGAEAQAAARVRDAIRGMQIELSVGTTIAITATIGVALTGPEENLASVIRRADLAMYQGKSAGRDRFVVAPPAA